MKFYYVSLGEGNLAKLSGGIGKDLDEGTLSLDLEKVKQLAKETGGKVYVTRAHFYYLGPLTIIEGD